MATVTLAESAKLTQDLLVQGVIENIITVNPFFDVVPFEGIEGNALAYNRENALGDVQTLAVGGTITAKNPATFTYVTSSLTTIIGDAEVNGLIEATRSNHGSQTSTQVASKAKSAGRKFQDMLVNGAAAGADINGLLALVDPSKKVYAGAGAANGSAYTLNDLDTLIDLVTDKDGQVDYLTMNAQQIRQFNVLLRALGGASVNEVIELPSGRKVPHYRGIPIFRNDYLLQNQTRGSSAVTSTIFAGTFDDGSMKQGIAGLNAAKASGIVVKEIGEKEAADETITRVKWYCGLALYNLNGLAALGGCL